jgi:hypothetical protein
MIAEIRHRFTMVSDSDQLWKQADDARQQRRHGGKMARTLRRAVRHSDFPRKMPVGRISSTITRMTNDTANL